MRAARVKGDNERPMTNYQHAETATGGHTTDRRSPVSVLQTGARVPQASKHGRAG
jgi:hypothetical protein